MKRIGTAANASLTSNRSMSSIVRPALASALRVAGIGPVSMIVGSAPESAVATMRARGVEAERLAHRLAADQHRRRAVDDARRVAGGVHVLDALDLRIARQRDRVEAHRAELGEGGLELAEAFERRARLDELVALEHGQADLVVDRRAPSRSKRPAACAAAARCCDVSA